MTPRLDSKSESTSSAGLDCSVLAEEVLVFVGGGLGRTEGKGFVLLLYVSQIYVLTYDTGISQDVNRVLDVGMYYVPMVSILCYSVIEVSRYSITLSLGLIYMPPPADDDDAHF